MNYYERHLGDYARDTAHLSMLEHGAYTLLLDRYYATEAGIPADQAHRVGRARSKEEKQAVDAVLQEFFKLVDGVWIKSRVEEEITKAQTKIKTAKENGKRGGRPKKNQQQTEEKPNGFPVGSESETQEKAHQTPGTKHQEPTRHGGSESTIPGTAPQQFTPTPAGLACKAIREAGIADCNPQHPTLLALLDAGATAMDFTEAAKQAIAKQKPNFAYLLGIVKGQREDAAALNLKRPPRENFDAKSYGDGGRI